MTALLVLGALLTLAQAAAGWVLWRRVREATHVINHNAREITKALDCIAALEAKAPGFAQSLRADLASLEKRTNDAFAREESALAALRADLEQHRKGSRHRRKP